MTSCKHRILVLLPEKKNLRRCQHCHLTIRAEELGESYCPECFENQGRKRFEFEEVAVAHTAIVRYRCEECGVIVESD